ncbi:hypothetical protein IMZ48_35880 [Candidatus Bathyarchaeota archaeon]|nr:hypothetical protein [Candidatus Bathyarchaeota archaeon]
MRPSMGGRYRGSWEGPDSQFVDGSATVKSTGDEEARVVVRRPAGNQDGGSVWTRSEWTMAGEVGWASGGLAKVDLQWRALVGWRAGAYRRDPCAL